MRDADAHDVSHETIHIKSSASLGAVVKKLTAGVKPGGQEKYSMPDAGFRFAPFRACAGRLFGLCTDNLLRAVVDASARFSALRIGPQLF